MKKYGWLLFIFIILLIMNFLTPISVADDGAYALVKEPVGLEYDVSRPINSLLDLCDSQINFWHTVNGRIGCQSIAQLFIGILGKTAFNVVNALVFCLVIFLTLKLIGWENQETGYPLAFLAFLLLIPAFGETVLWFTGGFNYLWTAFSALLFFYLLKNLWDEDFRFKHILWCPFVFFLGWTHEVLTLPISTVLGLYCLFNIRRIHSRAVFPLMLFFMLGTAMNVLAPATFVRAHAEGIGDAFSSITAKLKSFAVSVLRLKAFWTFVICVCLTFGVNRKRCIEYFRTYKWLILLVLFSFFVILMAGYSNARVHFGTEFLSIVALLGLINHCNLIKNTKVMRILIVVPILLLTGFILYYQKVNYDHYKVCENQMKDSNTLMILTPTDRIPDFWSNFLMKHVDYGEDVYYLACDKEKTMVRYMSALYGKNGMFYFPQAILDDIKTNPSHYDDFYTLPDVGLYVKRIEGNRIAGKAFFELREPVSGEVPFYLLPFAKYISAFSSLRCHPVNQTVVEINNSHYFVVPKPLQGMAERVKRVGVE